MQYYHLNVKTLRQDAINPKDAAVLCAQLPQDSRIFRALDPDNAYGYTQYLLRSIEYSARVLTWQQTEDGVKGRNQPEPSLLPSEIGTIHLDDWTARKAYVDRVLGISKEGDSNG